MTNEIVFRKAERKRSKIRVSFSGLAGSGKTYSALRLARGLTDDWKKIALIDTENGRGDLYSNLGGYNIITLQPPFSPDKFIEAIKVCEKEGMEVIIIDSTSHEWAGAGGCNDINGVVAHAKFGDNTWAAWSVTLPLHRKFIAAITNSPCHVITTIRSEPGTEKGADGDIKKIAMKDVQHKEFGYEMTACFEMNRKDHSATIVKTVEGLFKKEDSVIVTEEHGRIIKAWSESGAVEKPTDDQTATFQEQLITLGMTQKKWDEAVKKKTGKIWEEMTIEEAGKWIKNNIFAIEQRKPKVEEEETKLPNAETSEVKVFDPDKVLKELEAKKNSGKKKLTENEKKFEEELDKSLEINK